MDFKTTANKVWYFIEKILISPFGQISFSSFFIAVVSGIFLAVPYDIKNPYDSLSLLLLTNPAGVFFRNMHYWSAQVFLLSSILHIIDHFRRKTEKKLNNGVWFRVTVSLFFLFYIMISGFILKGDADSEQAGRILRSLFEQIPIIGSFIGTLFLGREGDYQLVYVHHIATASILLWVIIVEHSKNFWAELNTFLYSLLFLVVIGLFFSAPLHDGKNVLIKGPWYFVGLQELLHWIPQTQLIILFCVLLLILFYLVKNLKEEYSLIVKSFFLILLFFYIILTIVGYFFRGENWEFILPWKSSTNFGTEFQPAFVSKAEEIEPSKFKVILGRREGCIVCHQMSGLSKSHDPEAIGCFSCHLGNAFTLNKYAAHDRMILIPGNLTDSKQTCGTAQCHPDIVPRIDNNIMSTMSGIVSVNRFVFDELTSPSVLSHVKDLGFSNADSHLRNLCASCHLGNEKTELGKINELSRGGGCNACHLNYSDDSNEQLNEYAKSKVKSEKSKNENQKLNFPKVHPDLNLQISNNHCFGCHSRSGRIATNYEGWFETLKSQQEVKGNKDYRVLMDERVFQKTKPDAHFEKGMECVDCHLAQEVMGDGSLYLHKEDQVKIQCTDCHSNQTTNRVSYSNLDYESRKIVDLKNAKREKTDFISIQKSKLPFTNAYVNSANQKYLVTKTKKDSLLLIPPAFVCSEGKAHQRVSCNSCHTEWVSYCVGCHTEYNPNEDGFDLLANKEIKGSWIEHPSDFYVDYPALGVRKDNSTGKETIETFIPGMIISLDKMKNDKQKKIFKRLFAPTFSHTINKNGRSCKSCHNNPLALGYGKGELNYLLKGKTGEWNFNPEFSLLPQDNLPKDAWIGFLQTRNEKSTTRTNTRPFTIDEQKRILLVGACLSCHDENSKVMNESLHDFEKLLKRVSTKCVLPN
ncbi:MAG: cytochrome bc complex cytochrome b subunit [Ignavibacteriaceae bacterium]|nr:cytochrome bc complex cytochrome b subunit [Ignavibacteriaceae bacterium]